MLNIVCGLAVHNPSGGTLDFKWWECLNEGKNQTPQKSLDQKLTPQKCQANLFVLFSQNYNLARIRRYYLVLNTPKNPYFRSNHQKKILAKFSYLKKFWNRKFQTPQNPSIMPVIWNPEYPRGSITVGWQNYFIIHAI